LTGVGWRGPRDFAARCLTSIAGLRGQSRRREACSASLRRSAGTPTALRCSVSWPVAKLTSLTSFRYVQTGGDKSVHEARCARGPRALCSSAPKGAAPTSRPRLCGKRSLFALEERGHLVSTQPKRRKFRRRPRFKAKRQCDDAKHRHVQFDLNLVERNERPRRQTSWFKSDPGSCSRRRTAGLVGLLLRRVGFGRGSADVDMRVGNRRGGVRQVQPTRATDRISNISSTHPKAYCWAAANTVASKPPISSRLGMCRFIPKLYERSAKSPVRKSVEIE
jgi:hypothetical protein